MADGSVADNAVIVTASRRLARHLRLRHAAGRAAAGAAAWVAPRYLPWDVWLAEVWQAAGYRPEAPLPAPVLTPRQSRTLWERAASRALGESTLAATGGLAAQAAASWQRACDWRVPPEALREAARSPDATFLARAIGYYTAACEEGGWQDPAALADALAARFRRGEALVDGPVAFAGFERPAPAQRDLADAMREAGVAVTLESGEGRPAAATVSVRAAPDRDAELRAAGAWARERLLAQPECRVGIIVPDLAAGAARAARLIGEGFSPGWQLRPGSPAGINVSYGRPLAEYGLVDAALGVLGLIRDDPDFAALGRLLRSPFLAPVGADGRAALEIALRDLPDRRWDLARLPEALGRPADRLPESAGEFVETLAGVAAQREDWRSRAMPAVWAERMDTLLTAVGWGRETAMDSETWQLVNAWRNVLNQFAATGPVSGPVSGHGAVAQVAAIARETLFQPESDDEAVQVMGMLEASGMTFDALWIAGLDTTTWPPPQRPDPLLPIGLQRDYGMPDATPADTLDYARRIYTGLLGSAPEVVLSWPRREGDAELTPSPLLAGLPTAGSVAEVPVYAETLAGGAALVPVEPDPAPPLAAGETLPGGHGVLSAQRTQPFDAFARYRLRAEPLETPVAGLSARERGTVIHRALEAVYRHWPDRDRLAGAGADDRAQAAADAVERALARYARGADARLAGLIALESERCAVLVARFIEADLGRPGFREVICEEPREVAVGPLRLSIRPDRIDAVDGGWAIIDYKTGATGTATGTDPENPRQLQLVVYAISQPGRVRALAVGVVHPHRIGYRGAREADLEWPGSGVQSVDDWPGLLNAWKAQAHGLAEAVAAGDARVNLSLGLDAQRPLAVLSRVAELTDLADGEQGP
jgi:probable DNA repair protein